ncbi:hypothetical protein RJ639_013805 [Escallonia herrerae]|uniref:Pentatricopeptide repeat-containing protein n=1 Tax=Escallonia herrerae TaxID=1293975 RepID=A0AA88VQ55_9ASTE|nr:hypothetical protein RJ639_013805 [Escallonia herrerae]
MNLRHPITAVQFKRQLSGITTHLMNTHDPSHRINTNSPLVEFGASKPDSESTHFDSYLTHSFCSNALKRSAKVGSSTEGKRVHSHLIKLGYYNVLALQTQLLNVYVKCKQVYDARKLFDEMPARNVVTWNVVICGLADSGRGFRRMLLEMAGPDKITFTSLLRSCIEHDDAEMGRQLHCFIVKSGFCEDCFVNSALVDLHAKFGLVEDARRVFDSVLEKDTVLWNVMVSCYALNGLPEEQR